MICISQPSPSFTQFMFEMVLQQALQITDFDIQRSLLKQQIIKVYVLYALILQ
jgi:hypothetical protein